MSNSFYHEHYCLTKAQQEIIEPLLPAPKLTGRPALNFLTVFNAILWILSSGAAWRDLPPQFGNRNIEIDLTFCKVHRHAAGARKKHGNQAIGVSHGGKTLFIAFCSARIRKFIQEQGFVSPTKPTHEQTFTRFAMSLNASSCG